MAVSTEDQLAIADHMARYCWAVDDGDEEAWAALWAEDAVCTGLSPEPLVGREALREIVASNMRHGGGGKSRHAVSNLVCDYAADDRDTIRARYYNMVTNWKDGGRFLCMALSHVTLARDGAGWLIRDSNSTLFLG
jgi:ketosteroid isomerase-like protein